jgi:hypothetical protein
MTMRTLVYPVVKYNEYRQPSSESVNTDELRLTEPAPIGALTMTKLVSVDRGHWSYEVRRQASEHVFNTWNLEWTTTPPTEPGVYWVCTTRGVVHIAEVDWTLEKPRRLMALVTAEETLYELSLFPHWLGPLPEPPAPSRPA